MDRGGHLLTTDGSDHLLTTDGSDHLLTTNGSGHLLRPMNLATSSQPHLIRHLLINFGNDFASTTVYRFSLFNSLFDSHHRDFQLSPPSLQLPPLQF
jgi:hypothetical protein